MGWLEGPWFLEEGRFLQFVHAAKADSVVKNTPDIFLLNPEKFYDDNHIWTSMMTTFCQEIKTFLHILIFTIYSGGKLS